MASIVSVREFNQGLRDLKEGETYIVVDAVRRKIVTVVTVQNKPEAVEKNIKLIYTR